MPAERNAIPVKQRDILLTARPRRIRIWATVSASVVVIVSIVVGILLRSSTDGVTFRVQDQVGVIGVGLLIGAGIMCMARPRLQAGAHGVWVRNILGENFFDWQLILRVAFPEGANWAQLILPDDEVHPLMAIQAIDRERAVRSLAALRQLHARYAPRPPQPAQSPAEHEFDLLAQELNRPLGRLEIIDRQKAAQHAADLAAGRKPRKR